MEDTEWEMLKMLPKPVVKLKICHMSIKRPNTEPLLSPVLMSNIKKEYWLKNFPQCFHGYYIWHKSDQFYGTRLWNRMQIFNWLFQQKANHFTKLFLLMCRHPLKSLRFEPLLKQHTQMQWKLCFCGIIFMMEDIFKKKKRLKLCF